MRRLIYKLWQLYAVVHDSEAEMVDPLAWRKQFCRQDQTEETLADGKIKLTGMGFGDSLKAAGDTER